MRNIGIIIVLALWLFVGYSMCECYDSICGDAEETVQATTPLPPPPVKTIDRPDEPICFGRNSCEPHFGSGFAAMRDSLIGALPEGSILRIIGTYGPSEKNESDFDNLGMCRADAVKTRFAEHISADRLATADQLSVGQGAFTNGVSTDRVRYEIVDKAAPAVPSTTLIYFPFNSTNKLDDRDVESYLNSVADQVKGSGKRVRLVGHTDNIGGQAPNQALGLRRAQIIKDYLVTRGVSGSQVLTSSRGEDQPVATNNTDAGRAKNRRTELTIIN